MKLCQSYLRHCLFQRVRSTSYNFVVTGCSNRPFLSVPPGWMYYNKEHLGDRPTRMEKAVQLLLKAIETDPNSGAAWYLIGRSVLLVIDGHIKTE